MEIFVTYQSFYSIGGYLFAKYNLSSTNLHFLSLIVGVGIWAALFILQGFGLWKMAKKRNLPKKWLAFMPFANYLYMGKLAGECSIFGRKVKHMGLFVMIAQIVATVFSVLLIMAMSYLLLVEGTPTFVEDSLGMSVPYWNGTGFSQTVERFYRIGAGYTFGISIFSILQLVYDILLLILMMGLYRRYSPKSYTWLSLIVVFIPSARFIVTFCLRNRDEVDWDAYMRARREAYARQYQQQYGGYGNPYGNPYGNNGNPYGAGTPYGNQGMAQPQKPDDPFGEFGEKEEKPFEEFGDTETQNPDNGGDDFF